MRSFSAVSLRIRSVSAGSYGVRECPQGAKTIRSDIDRARTLLAERDAVAVSVAPSLAAAFSPAEDNESSGVTELCCLLRVADRVQIDVGQAENPAGENIAFRQRGLLRRSTIVDLLTEKLRGMGKLVVVRRHTEWQAE